MAEEKPDFCEAIFNFFSKEGPEKYPIQYRGNSLEAQNYKRSLRRAARDNYRVCVYLSHIILIKIMFLLITVCVFVLVCL